MSFISIKNLEKTYRIGENNVQALAGVSTEITQGEFLAVCGPSGSGKSTFMNIIGGIDAPGSGSVAFEGKKIDYSDLSKLAGFRLQTIGFIFQSFNLVPVLSVFENIEYPLLLTNLSSKEREDRVNFLIERVGLKAFAGNKPAELSGGQKQRVAIARALVNWPKLVLADEPTANLDSNTSHQILQLMREINREEKTTFMITTHDELVFTYTDREIEIHDGKIKEKDDVAIY